jgi:RNA polymerase sigma-70 factor (ECF subfamily)
VLRYGAFNCINSDDLLIAICSSAFASAMFSHRRYIFFFFRQLQSHKKIFIFIVTNHLIKRLYIKLQDLQKQEAEKQFEKHIKEHELLIYKICRIYAYTDADRQDLFQDIVVQLWNAYPKFKGESKLSTWLYRVAINTAITGLRKKKDFIQSFEHNALPANISDDNSLHAEERLQEMYKAIEQLNQVEKAIVMLYLEDKTYEEMEEILGINQRNLRVKMNRVKDKLRNLTNKH